MRNGGEWRQDLAAAEHRAQQEREWIDQVVRERELEEMAEADRRLRAAGRKFLAGLEQLDVYCTSLYGNGRAA